MMKSITAKDKIIDAVEFRKRTHGIQGFTALLIDADLRYICSYDYVVSILSKNYKNLGLDRKKLPSGSYLYLKEKNDKTQNISS